MKLKILLISAMLVFASSAAMIAYQPHDATVPAHTASSTITINATYTEQLWREYIGYSTPSLWRAERNASEAQHVSESGEGGSMLLMCWQSPYQMTVGRTFASFDISPIPVGAGITNITLYTSWISGVERTFYVISDPLQSHPQIDDPIAEDFFISNYSLVLAKTKITAYTGAVSSYFNATGLSAVREITNLSISKIYFGLCLVLRKDLLYTTEDDTSTPEAGMLRMKMVIVTDGGGVPRGPSPPHNIYEDFDPDWITSALATLFWISGLGGMIIVPMLIVARAKESGDLASRFENVVVLVGLWVFCLGIFIWALS